MERQVNELKAKIDQIEKRNAEQRAAEEKKHAEDITFYKKTNQQLKVNNIFIENSLWTKINFYFIYQQFIDSVGRHYYTKEIKLFRLNHAFSLINTKVIRFLFFFNIIIKLWK